MSAIGDKSSELAGLGESTPADRDLTLDIFRAIAVLLVVLFHYTARLPREVFGATQSFLPEVSFGGIGVYFFFIISGFCIFFTLKRAPTIWTFFAKRFSRIYPAFAAAAILLFALDQVFQLPILPEYDYRAVAPQFVDLLGNLALLGGVFEWVSGSFWSITVEVQFYILIGLMALLIKQGERLARYFSYGAIVIGTLWLFAEILGAENQSLWTVAIVLKKILIAPYLPFFAVGVVGVQLKSKPAKFGVLFVALCLLSLFTTIVLSADGGPIFRVLPIVTGLILFGLIGMFAAYGLGWRLPNIPILSKVLGHIGLLSYSWYLLHENLGMLVLNGLNSAVPYWVSVLAAMGLTYAAAVLFSKAFEWRFRKPAEKMFAGVLSLVAKRVPKKCGEGLV